MNSFLINENARQYSEKSTFESSNAIHFWMRRLKIAYVFFTQEKIIGPFGIPMASCRGYYQSLSEGFF